MPKYTKKDILVLVVLVCCIGFSLYDFYLQGRADEQGRIANIRFICAIERISTQACKERI